MPSSMTAGTTAVWRTWVSSSDTNTSTSYKAGSVWNVWCDSTTHTASTDNSTSHIWYAWNDNQYVVAEGNSVYYGERKETEEQKQARLQREEAVRVAQEARLKADAEAREKAKEKAERLLVSHLNPVQLQQLKEMDAFIVELETKRYKVRRNNKVLELDKEGKQIAQYCIHPYENVPAADTMLSQKLMLECDEASFLRIANRSMPPMVQ